MFNENIDRQRMLFVLLVDGERFLIQSMLRGNLRNVGGVVVLEFVDVSNDLSFVRTDGSKEHQVLQIAVVAEW